MKPIKNLILAEIIDKIERNPRVGHELRGDLQGIYIYNFSVDIRPYVLSYRLKNDRIEVISIGPRNKYFRE
jgi:hypothetical protein